MNFHLHQIVLNQNIENRHGWFKMADWKFVIQESDKRVCFGQLPQMPAVAVIFQNTNNKLFKTKCVIFINLTTRKCCPSRQN